MTEADAEQLVAALVALQQERLERLNPRIGGEGIGLAAGHQIGVIALVVGRVDALDHVEQLEAGRNRLLREQALEHAPITLVAVDQLGAKAIGFENADAKRHGRILAVTIRRIHDG